MANSRQGDVLRGWSRSATVVSWLTTSSRPAQGAARWAPERRGPVVIVLYVLGSLMTLVVVPLVLVFTTLAWCSRNPEHHVSLMFGRLKMNVHPSQKDEA